MTAIDCALDSGLSENQAALPSKVVKTVPTKLESKATTESRPRDLLASGTEGRGRKRYQSQRFGKIRSFPSLTHQDPPGMLTLGHAQY
jgi:hypothetical protein